MKKCSITYFPYNCLAFGDALLKSLQEEGSKGRHKGVAMRTFKVGQKLEARSICDSECIFTATVVKRTAKRVTIRMDGREKVCGIHFDNPEAEYIYPHGKYSMASVFRA